MPVAQTRGHAGKALAIASVSIVLIVAVAFLVAQAASRGDVEIKLGDERFDAGEVESIAARIDKDGDLPILYPDLVGRDRNLFVQHLDDDPDKGWVTFSAFDPDDPTCAIEIDREAKLLVNACDPEVTYPLDGQGLRFYPTVVDGGRVIVDINELTTSTTAG